MALVTSAVGMALFAVGSAAYPEPVARRVDLIKAGLGGVAQILMPVAAPLLAASVLAAAVSLMVRIRSRRAWLAARSSSCWSRPAR